MTSSTSTCGPAQTTERHCPYSWKENKVHSRSTLAALLISISLLIGGCDKSDAPQSVAQPGSPPQQKMSAEQAEVEKYNVYVKAANYGADFGELLEKRLNEYPKKLAAGKKLTDYYIFSTYDISTWQKNLKEALAIESPMPELDEPAKGMLETLAKLAPVQAELENYAQSKGFLADDGKKAREMEPALQAAMKDVAVYQAVFFDGINKRDDINTKNAFESAEKDSQAYYRAGIVVYAKESARLASEFFQNAGSEETAKPFEASLSKTAQMIEGWDKKTREQTRSPGCTVVLSDLNGFVGKGRQAISDARSGQYKRENNSELGWRSFNPVERGAKDVQRAFGSLINSMNRDECI
ncbi:hypothetical protein CU665_09520 [Pseudomonas syringae pv. actinidifoliorum]|nr:hypothetical protein [Pseudomonas syringae pv. actinidifoliorum]NAT37958.1 hypothetical protein [Pseudomonas syringae pv. actinidifoliorum]